MSITLAQLAEAIDAELRGEGSLEVTGCAGLEESGPNDVTFLANRKYVRLLADTRAAAVIVSPKDADEHPGRTLLVADDPYFAFRQAVVALYGFRKHPDPGVSNLAFVDPDATLGADCCVQPFAYIAARARIGDRCVIYPHCYIGPDVVVGDDCILYPHVVVYDFCELGDRVILQAGCVIGQDGFGYATHQLPGEEPRHHKIPQVGNVVIEDDVEMGAGCTIDRATVGSTRIGRGTKFSDLIAIGHGCNVGKHNLLVAQAGLAGSVTTGDYVVMGGQVGVVGHVRIGHGAQLAGKSAVINDIPDGKAQYGGQPALPISEAKRAVLSMYQVPDLLKQFRQLKRKVEQLEQALEPPSPD